MKNLFIKKLKKKKSIMVPLNHLDKCSGQSDLLGVGEFQDTGYNKR